MLRKSIVALSHSTQLRARPTAATSPHTLRIVPSDQHTRPVTEPHYRRLDSYFARLLLSLLAVVLPFFAIAVLVPDLGARFGLGPRLLAAFVLIGIAGLAAQLMIRPVIALSRAAARVESGDLSARVVPGGSGETRQLGQTFNAMLERLSGMLAGLRGEVADSAGELAAAAEQLAAVTAEQTSAASQTSATMEELSRGTLSIADTAAGVATQAGEVRASIAGAQTELQAAADRVVGLARRVGEIEGILVLLNDIADQTNLLALNAAIEAARAGDSGRGFAVVADEVRRLAERSKAAAGQIATLLVGAQVESQATVTAVERRGRQMALWLDMMRTMAEASGQVQLATQAQRSSVEQAVVAVELIAERCRSVAATAQGIALAASRQGELATDLAWSATERGAQGQEEEDR
jgi:methyl-accepting chemotaxis protein